MLGLERYHPREERQVVFHLQKYSCHLPFTKDLCLFSFLEKFRLFFFFNKHEKSSRSPGPSCKFWLRPNWTTLCTLCTPGQMFLLYSWSKPSRRLCTFMSSLLFVHNAAIHSPWGGISISCLNILCLLPVIAHSSLHLRSQQSWMSSKIRFYLLIIFPRFPLVYIFNCYCFGFRLCLKYI